MTTIIAGNFQEAEQSLRAVAGLEEAGFTVEQIATFFVNPPGQHNLYPIGGDEDKSPGTENAGEGSAVSAVVGGAVGLPVGLATLPVLGPAAALAGAGVGAYTGSFVGALGAIDDENNPATTAVHAEVRHRKPIRKSGMLVAVSAISSVQQDTAIRVMRQFRASDLERAEGNIVASDWTDFSPMTPLNLI